MMRRKRGPSSTSLHLERAKVVIEHHDRDTPPKLYCRPHAL
jgi:hypothetical protein